MTLLSIVGDDISQLIPVIYEYKNVCKTHILLCDQEEKNLIRAKDLLKGLQRFSSRYNLSLSLSIEMIDEHNLNTLKQQLKHFENQKEECWVNITDAYPMVSILLTQMAHEYDAKVISYDHFNNKLHVIDKHNTVTCHALESRLSIDDYLTLLNYRIVEQSNKKKLQYDKEDISYLYKHFKRFKPLRLALLKNNRAFAYSRYEDLLLRLEKRGIVKNGKLIVSQSKVLSGDLFEEYIFWLIESLKPDDIALGVKIDFDDKKDPTDKRHHIFNEFDILLTHNNRIFTIECKYATQLDGLEYVYKYDAIIDYFGKTSKAIIVNLSSTPKESYLQMKSSRNFNHSTLRRARLSGIHVHHESVINEAKLQSLVQSFFHIGGQNDNK